MNATYPEWRSKAQDALEESQRPKPKAPKPPTRAQLIEELRVEIRALTENKPRLRGKLLLMIDAIQAAKR